MKPDQYLKNLSILTSLAVTGCLIWSSVMQPIAFAQSTSISLRQERLQLAQAPDFSRPVERKIPGVAGTIVTGFRYDPNTKEIGVLLSGDHVIKPIIEKQEEQRPKYTDYNRVTIKDFRYRGVDVGRQEIRVDARVRYQKLENRPLGGRYTTFDQAADITLGANFEVKNRQLEAATYIRRFEPGWASGPLGFVYSAFDAAFGVIAWVAKGEFITISKVTGTLGSAYVNLAQPQKELVNSMFSEVNRWNAEGLVYLNRTDYDADGIWLLFKADQNQTTRLQSRLSNLVNGYFPGLIVNNQLNLVASNSSPEDGNFITVQPSSGRPTCTGSPVFCNSDITGYNSSGRGDFGDDPPCFNVDSRTGWQSVTVPQGYYRIADITGGWTVDANNYAPVGAEGHTGAAGEALAPFSQYKFVNWASFGALILEYDSQIAAVNVGREVISPSGTRTVKFRINDNDQALGDNQGSLQVCFGQ
jgi:hypothetical protein